MNQYADAISNKGAALDNCFGFIDGTVRPISRADANQRIVCNGHKRVHALKFQSVALPNGLIGHLYDPALNGHPIQVLRHNVQILKTFFPFFSQKEGCTMHECWQFLICMMIWKISPSVQPEEKCVYMVTQPIRLESTSKPLSELGF